jgi:hypothetical protein
MSRYARLRSGKAFDPPPTRTGSLLTDAKGVSCYQNPELRGVFSHC